MTVAQLGQKYPVSLHPIFDDQAHLILRHLNQIKELAAYSIRNINSTGAAAK
jgi:hypothetical protein